MEPQQNRSNYEPQQRKATKPRHNTLRISDFIKIDPPDPGDPQDKWIATMGLLYVEGDSEREAAMNLKEEIVKLIAISNPCALSS